MNNSDIVAITETWLKEDVLSSEYLSTNYSVYRANNRGRGRGVLLAVKSHLVSKKLPLVSPIADVDLIGISLSLNDQLKLNIINVYLPPGSPTEYYDVIFEYLENCLLSSNTVIVGDFNIPQYYVQMVLNKALNYISGSSIFLRDFLNVNNLRQCNFVLNSNTRLLDLVLISDNLNCTVSRNENPLVTEDQHHPSLSLTLGIPMSKSKDNKFVTANNCIKYNFRRGDYNGLYSALCKIDWFRLMVITNVNEALDSFYDEIFNLFNTYIPKSTVRTSSYPMWFTPTIIDLVKKKQQLWKRFKKFGYERDLMQVNSLRKRIKNDIKKEYTNFVSLAEHNIKGDPKNLWKYINLKKIIQVFLVICIIKRPS